MKNVETIVDVCNEHTLEQVFECISRLNNGSDHVVVRAYGGNLSKGVQIAQILEDELGAHIDKSSINTVKVYKDYTIPYIEIPIIASKTHIDRDESSKPKIKEQFGDLNFINFPTYHLLLNWYLSKFHELKFQVRDRDHRVLLLLTVRKEGDRITYQKGSHLSRRNRRDNTSRYSIDYSNKVDDTLYRSGVLMPARWEKIAEKLSMQDDVILGLDTNMLYKSAITRFLLPAVGLIEPRGYMHTPSWILLVVPGTVMHELEEAANLRDDYGKLLDNGRMGFRALQEIIELSENIDIPGISLFIYGESDPALDTKGDLINLRKDIHRLYEDYRKHTFGSEDRYPFRIRKSSAGDMTIRTQFKKFLGQLDFHKETFFLTADKTNAALALAEGLHPIYISYPGIPSRQTEPFEGLTLPDKNPDSDLVIRLNPPLGTLIYEMAVTFGDIIVSCGDKAVTFTCDPKGESLGHWLRKRLQIKRPDLEALLEDYKGKFDLKECVRIWKTLNDKIENIEWIVDLEDVFTPDTHAEAEPNPAVS